MTRGIIKSLIKTNLDNAGSVFYNDTELNDSIQDAYDDIVILTQSIVKNSTISWVAKNYYDFKTDHSISDYLSTIAVFNNLTNMWLRDDLAYRQFDRIRRDWENWRGQSQFWAPVNYQYIAVTPYNSPATGTFKLVYSATAPTLTGDSSTFLIAADMMKLVEDYVSADLLETAEEYTKASDYWTDYFKGILIYKERCHNLAKADLMLRV